MDLMDILGGVFGGQSGGGPNDEMLAQLGIDPTAMRRQAAMQSLGSMGAAMLAHSGPSRMPVSMASALGEGLQAGQQSFADNQRGTVNQNYMLSQMSRLKAQDTKDAEAQRRADEFAAQLKDPAFVATLPDELKPYTSMLGQLPPAQATDIIVAAQRAQREAAAQAAKDARGVISPFGYESTGLRRVLPTGEVQILQQPGHAPGPAGPQMPAWFNMLPPDQRQAALSHMAGLDKEPPPSAIDKADANATAKRIKELEGNIDTLNKREDAATRLTTGLTQGNYATAGDDPIGRVERSFYEKASPAFRPEAVNEFDKASQQFVLDTMSDLHNMRGSNLTTNTVQRSKPGVGLSKDSNIRILQNDILPAIGKTRDQLQAELDFYRENPGSTTRQWNPAPTRDAAGGAQASPAGPGAAPGPAAPSAGPGARAPAGGPTPQQAARLRQHPDLAAAFDAQFGQGAAAQILGGR